MTEEFVLTVRVVVDACKKALEDRTLGAFHTNSCQYVYRRSEAPALGCAIGVALPDHLREKVKRRPTLNGTTVGRLATNLEIMIPSEEVKWVLQFTQAFHDAWARNSLLMMEPGLLRRTIENPTLREFANGVNNTMVAEKEFREWIALLDEMYPA